MTKDPTRKCSKKKRKKSSHKNIDGLQLRHSFFRQNDWTSKHHYKALDVTVNQRIIPSVGIFKEFDCKVILL